MMISSCVAALFVAWWTCLWYCSVKYGVWKRACWCRGQIQTLVLSARCHQLSMFSVNKPFPSSWAWISSLLENRLLGKKYKQILSSTCETCLIFSRQLVTYTLWQSGHTCCVMQSRVRENWSLWMGLRDQILKLDLLDAWGFCALHIDSLPHLALKEKSLMQVYKTLVETHISGSMNDEASWYDPEPFSCIYMGYNMLATASLEFWNILFSSVPEETQSVCPVWYGVGQAICYLHANEGIKEGFNTHKWLGNQIQACNSVNFKDTNNVKFDNSPKPFATSLLKLLFQICSWFWNVDTEISNLTYIATWEFGRDGSEAWQHFAGVLPADVWNKHVSYYLHMNWIIVSHVIQYHGHLFTVSQYAIKYTIHMVLIKFINHV